MTLGYDLCHLWPDRVCCDSEIEIETIVFVSLIYVYLLTLPNRVIKKQTREIAIEPSTHSTCGELLSFF